MVDAVMCLILQLHATTSGLKAFSSNVCVHGMEVCVHACVCVQVVYVWVYTYLHVCACKYMHVCGAIVTLHCCAACSCVVWHVEATATLVPQAFPTCMLTYPLRRPTREKIPSSSSKPQGKEDYSHKQCSLAYFLVNPLPILESGL